MRAVSKGWLLALLIGFGTPAACGQEIHIHGLTGALQFMLILALWVWPLTIAFLLGVLVVPPLVIRTVQRHAQERVPRLTKVAFLLAAWSLLLSLMTAIPALICAHISMKRNRGAAGRGLLVASIVMGYLQLVYLAGAGVALVFFAPHVKSGSGSAIDAVSGAPLSGVVVRLKCSSTDDGGVEREVEKVTDENGAYRFERKDVAECVEGTVTAEKDGYVNKYGRAHVSADSAIPGRIVMVDRNAATMERLAEIGRVVAAWKDKGASYYVFVYPIVEEAIRIARTEQEQRFVRESICPPIVEMYGGFSDDERERMRGTAISYGGQISKMDHEGLVVPYCSGRLEEH